MQFKAAYFQGTEEPKPKKKQYKSDEAIVVQPRFKTPLFKEYDLYENSSGPGAGYSSLQDYKSVSDFLKAKRKRNKDKYKADDSYIQDDGSITKKKSERRIVLLKIAIDFPIDDQIQSAPILGNEGSYSDSVPIGGMFDSANPYNDFEGKSPDKMNFGEDEDFDEHPEAPYHLEEFMDKFLRPKEAPINGAGDWIDPEELDADKTISQRHQDYGVVDQGNNTYKDISLQ